MYIMVFLVNFNNSLIVSSFYSFQRARNSNVIPYHAAYFGHKIHLDQNEKLNMYGATHVIAIDGYSSCIFGSSTMPVKNNLTIYDEVYRWDNGIYITLSVSDTMGYFIRPAVLTHGIWDTVRVDNGREFFLTLYMQDKNANLRYNQSRSSYIQSKSTQVGYWIIIIPFNIVPCTESPSRADLARG